MYQPKEFFIPAVLKVFEEISRTYSFTTQIIDDSEVKLNNNKCIINIIDNKDEYEVRFSNPADSTIPYYDLGDIYFVLYNEPMKFLKIPERNITAEEHCVLVLQAYIELINNYFENILKGDFSWHNNYVIYTNRSNKLFAEALRSPLRSSIMKKIRKNDPSWMLDMEIYLTKQSNERDD